MAAVELYSRAVAVAQDAVKLDDEGHLEEAIAAYAQALSLIDAGVAVDADPAQRQLVLNERQRYQVRTSLLRSLLDKQQQPKALDAPESSASAAAAPSSAPAAGAADAASAADAAAATAAAATAAATAAAAAAAAPRVEVTPVEALPATSLVAVVHSLREQSRAMLLELQAAQDEACVRLETEMRCRGEAMEAKAEAARLREEVQRLQGELEESERGRLSSLVSTSGPNASCVAACRPLVCRRRGPGGRACPWCGTLGQP